MIIHISDQMSRQEYAALEGRLSLSGIRFTSVTTQQQRYYVCIPMETFDIRAIGNLSGVLDVHRVNDAYKLVSSQWKTERSTIDLGSGIVISDKDFSLMAGPCSIESEKQIETVTDFLLSQGVRIMRGGVFKPRSSPYAFRGLGIEGLKLFHSICRAKGLKIVTEVMQVAEIEQMAPYVDIFQVGARNAQNFNLLDALGGIDIPVLLKRGISGTIEELLQSAEYIFSKGNEKIMLCERGIRTFEHAYRNTFDINAISILKEKSHLPVIADPSHGIGLRKHVSNIAMAAFVAGADGAIVEIHPEPENAFSDGQQTLDFEEFTSLLKKIKSIKEVLCT